MKYLENKQKLPGRYTAMHLKSYMEWVLKFRPLVIHETQSVSGR